MKTKIQTDGIFLEALFYVNSKIQEFLKSDKRNKIEKTIKQIGGLYSTIFNLQKDQKKSRILWNQFDQQRVIKIDSIGCLSGKYEKDVIGKINLSRFQDFLGKNKNSSKETLRNQDVNL